MLGGTHRRVAIGLCMALACGGDSGSGGGGSVSGTGGTDGTGNPSSSSSSSGATGGGTGSETGDDSAGSGPKLDFQGDEPRAVTLHALEVGAGFTFQEPVASELISTLQADESTRVGLALSDVDGDGELDAIVTTEREVLVGRGQGSGQFGAGDVVASSGNPFACDPIVTDLDSDGTTDVAVGSCRDAYRVTLLVGQGDGTFLDPQVIELGAGGSGEVRLSAADLDGDGGTDLAALALEFGEPNRVVALRSPTLTPESVGESSGSELGWISSADFDGDTRDDLVVMGAHGPLRVFQNLGTGFAPGVDLELAPSCNSRYAGLAAGDLDGDGLTDVATGWIMTGDFECFQGYGLALSSGAGDGTFAAPQIPPAGMGSESLVADLDGAPPAEVVWVENNRVGVTFADGGSGELDSVWSEPQVPSLGPDSRSGVAAADVIGSSELDVVVASLQVP